MKKTALIGFGSLALWAMFVMLSFSVVGCTGPGGNNTDGGTSGMTGDNCKDGVCILTGTITENMTLKADKKYLLRGGVFVGDDKNETILTIEPGTTIFGETSTNGMLVIRRGSKIMAEGSRDKPIVFTSSKPKGQRAPGDWGGLIINGRARINACPDDAKGPCEAFGEGGTGYYGGDKDDDNSGVLKYVRIEFAGRLVSPDNELNGIAFQAVGSGTKIEYIQVHKSKDDGIEFFGGTANFKYVLTTSIGDDNLDWTDGWRGKGQFFVAQQYPGVGDNGIEADNNGDKNDASPRSAPTLSNLTLIGSPDSKKSDLGILLREGTAAKIYNAVVVGFNEHCLAIDHEETFKNAYKDGKLTGNLVIENSIISCKSNFKEFKDDKKTVEFKVEDFFKALNPGNKMVDPMLEDPYNVKTPNFAPKANSPILTGAKELSDSFFSKVKFLGGVDPKNDWTKGWTTSDEN